MGLVGPQGFPTRPSLICKCICYAFQKAHLLHNLGSLIKGVGKQDFPQSWWHLPLWRLYDCLRLDRVVSC